MNENDMSLPTETWKDVPHEAHPDDGIKGCAECEAETAIPCPDCFSIPPNHSRKSCAV